MTVWRRATARYRNLGTCIAIAGVLAGPAGLHAQNISINVATLPENGHPTDSISPAPVVIVQGSQVPAEAQPASLTLELSLDPQFTAPFFVRSASGVGATFVVNQLLPERTVIYFRGRVIDAAGVVRATQVVSHPVRSWLRLLEPTQRSNDVLFTRTPEFVWSSPPISLPPGPWQYTIDIINTATGGLEPEHTLNDTSFVPTNPLDACTSYRWRVTARAVNGKPNDQITVNSPGTFVIQSAECPAVTLFYQNFPNPFGRGSLSPETCFWFDLAHRSTVSLVIYDIRLRVVRHIVPGLLPAVLDSGAYGRQNGANQAGCDTRLEWDGRDDRGNSVPPGVYIAVFDANGVHSTKKIVFRGP